MVAKQSMGFIMSSGTGCLKSSGSTWKGAAALIMAMAMAGCAVDSKGIDLTSLLPAAQSTESSPETSVTPAPTGDKSAASPSERPRPVRPVAELSAPEANPALAEARALRQAGRKAQALAVLDKAAAGAPGDMALTRDRGLLALDTGALDKAWTLLKVAADKGPPDWRVHSGLGATLASLGRQQEAQVEFAKALELAPDHPSVLNNLALSYALDGQHEQAEQLLRRVAQSGKPHVQQNLALILAFKGRPEEARKISEATLPPEQARANAAFLAGLTSGGKTPVSQAAIGSPQRSAEVRPAGEPAPIYRLGGPAN